MQHEVTNGRDPICQCFSTAGPRTGAGPRLLSCRSAKYISILYINWKMLKADPLLSTCGRLVRRSICAHNNFFPIADRPVYALYQFMRSTH